MSDFESRLRDTLVRGAADAPVDVDLAGGARRRLRRRRTTSVAVAAAAALAVAGPVVAWQVGGSPRSSGSGEVATEPPSASPVDVGWRAETWHHVTFEVPQEWGLGGTGAWCTQEDLPAALTPSVSRPTDAVATIACSPLNGYGVTVGSSAGVLPVEESGAVWQYHTEGVDQATYPDDAWLGMWHDDRAVVTVATPDRALTQQIMDSIEVVEGMDPYGCPASLEEAESAVDGSLDPVSVCEYDEQGLLAASRRYAGAQAEQFWAALSAAPLRETAQGCPSPKEPIQYTAVLAGGGYVATIARTHCEAVYLSGVTRALTDDVRRFLYPFPR